MSNPNHEWLHMYQQNFSNQPSLLSDHEMNSSNNIVGSSYGDGLVSDATIITTSVTTAASPPTSASSLSPDGRVGKPVRRRSRASRRTPTTLLNTDAANFRAMVQQFTGGPSNSTNAPGFAFGFGNSSRPVIDPTAVTVPPGGYHLPMQQQHQQPQIFQFQNQHTTAPFMFSLSNNSGNAPSEAFLQTHGGSRPVTYNMGVSDSHSYAPPRPS